MKTGLGISSVRCFVFRCQVIMSGADVQLLPLFFPLTYFVLLPPFQALAVSDKGAYRPLSTGQDELGSAEGLEGGGVTLSVSLEPDEHVRLSTADKVALVKPLVIRYMLPLFAVYVEEYVINSVSASFPPITFVCVTPLSSYTSRIATRVHALISGGSANSGLPSAYSRYLVSPLQNPERLLSLLVSSM